MESHFTIDTKEFKKMISEANKLIKGAAQTSVKISVLPDTVEFQFQGMQKLLKAESDTYNDVLVPFSVLYGFARTVSDKRIAFAFKDGEVKVGVATVMGPNIKVESLFSRKAADLPMNLTPRVLLRLKMQYPKEELVQLNLFEMVAASERDMEKEVVKAARLLAPYGISKAELLALIWGKLES